MAKGKKTGGRDWKPGQSGNPSGRPKDWLTAALKDYLKEKDPRAKLTRAEKVVARLYKEAVGGDVAAIKYIFDRVDGKVRENVEFEVPQGLKIVLARKEGKE